MLDYTSLSRCFEDLGLDSWLAELGPVVTDRLQDKAHGDFAKWRDALERLRAAADHETQTIREALLSLAPWRKGPFDVGGVRIDSEWQSNIKWDRLKHRIEPLDGRHVLDVGCGNGYYALRMRDAGASMVVGIDPTVLYVMQFLAIQRFVDDRSVHVLPLRLQELPAASFAFDTSFSMGVLYHQRSPIEHLRQLKDTLRRGGQLVLETLFIPGEESYACTPAERYARMRNVWLLPTIAELTTWLRRTGFDDIEVIDMSQTTTAEQRSTEWMAFESLAEALDPGDPGPDCGGLASPATGDSACQQAVASLDSVMTEKKE